MQRMFIISPYISFQFASDRNSPKRSWVDCVICTNSFPYRYCASPFSGMGTTLALVGAYNLAGALTKQISSLTQCNLSSPPCATAEVLESSIPASSLNAAFADYESATRPIVTKAQQLPPGMPWLIHPQTAWGIWVRFLEYKSSETIKRLAREVSSKGTFHVNASTGNALYSCSNLVFWFRQTSCKIGRPLQRKVEGGWPDPVVY